MKTVLPLPAVCVAAAALAAASCTGAPSSSASKGPAFSSSPIVVHGSEHIGWDQAITDGSDPGEYQFLAYVDGTATSLPDAACQPNPNGQLACTSGLPSMAAGPHRLRLSAVRESPGPSESPQSTPLDILVQPSASGSMSARVPTAGTAKQAATLLQLSEQTLLSGLDAPSALAATPDGRVFVVERTGNVRVWQSGHGNLPVATHIANAAQGPGGGAFGIAVDPNFTNNHRVYVAYTNIDQDGAFENRIVVFRELNSSLGEAAAIFVDRVRELPEAAPTIAFGPDGKLYAAFPGRAASNADYPGKVLRLNTDGSTPRDNPSASPIFTAVDGVALAFAWQPASSELWEIYRNPEGELVLGARPPDAGAVGPARLLAAGIEPTGMAFYGHAPNAPVPGDLLIATQSGEQILHGKVDPADPNRLESMAGMLSSEFGRISALGVAWDGSSLYFCTSNRAFGSGTPDDDRLVVASMAR